MYILIEILKPNKKDHAYTTTWQVWFYSILRCVTNVMTVPLVTTLSITVVLSSDSPCYKHTGHCVR